VHLLKRFTWNFTWLQGLHHYFIVTKNILHSIYNMVFDSACQLMLKKNHDEYTTRTQEETTYYLGQVKILREKSKLNNISFFEKDKLKVFKRDYNKIREYMYKEYISSSATFLFGSQMAICYHVTISSSCRILLHDK